MRIRLAAAFVALLVGVSAQPAYAGDVAISGPAEAAATAGGSFVPVPAFRAVDLTPLTANTPRTFAIAGLGGVPTNADAVVLTVSSVNAGGAGALFVYRAGLAAPDPTTGDWQANWHFAAGRQQSNTAVVDLGTNGVTLLASAAVSVVVDVAGYFRAGSGSGGGAFTSRTPIQIFNGPLTANAVAPSQSVNAVIGKPDLAAVVATVDIDGATTSGSLVVSRHDATAPAAAGITFGPGRTSGLVELPLSQSGRLAVRNASGGVVRVAINVVGYYAPGAPSAAGAFGSVGSAGIARVLDTRTGLGGNRLGAVPANTAVPVTVAGKGGVPAWNVAAVVGTLTAITPSAGGRATVYESRQAAPRTTNLQFTAGRNTSNLVVVPVSPTGQIALYNRASVPVHYVFEVSGYYLKNTLSVPRGATSHYIRKATGLATIGYNDAIADKALPGNHVHVLHIGAQTNRGTGGQRGVLLSATDIRMSDTYLVKILKQYLAGYRSARTTTTATIVVATNNSGTFSTYPAATKGAEWAANVVNPLRAYGAQLRLNVVGGNDIEAGFSGSLTQAKQWVSAYLSRTKATLVYTGSADACPDALATTADCDDVRDDNGVLKRWKRADYVALTYGLGPGRIAVLPQVYKWELANMAMQWVNIDLSAGRRIRFLGVLTEFDSNCGELCAMTPAAGWTTAWNAFAAIGVPMPAIVTDLEVNR